MGICRDQSTTYLKGLGYNVVRHPREGLGPLTLIGRQGGATTWLGELSGLLVDTDTPEPAVETDLAAAAINGKRSSKLDLGIGLNVLGSLISALGGKDIGAEVGYTNARTLTFLYENVLSDRVAPLDVDAYLTDATVNAAGPLVSEYVLGNGELFLIVETIKAASFTVEYERSDEVAASVDVPVLAEAVGAEVEVSTSTSSSGGIEFAGERPLVFGFRCMELGVVEGRLRLTNAPDGGQPLRVRAEPGEGDFAILTPEATGLLELDETTSAPA